MREINTTCHTLRLKTIYQKRSDNYHRSRHANSIFFGFLVKEVALRKGPSQRSFVPFNCHVSVMPISSGKVICVSLAHIIFGTLMTVCGVLQVILQLKFLWLDSFYTGIWVGIWMSFTGILGVIASFNIKFFVALFMFFSITSSLLGLASVSYYANTGAASWDVYWSSRYYLIISSATCLFAIVQVITGVVAGIYSCLAFGDDTQSEQASVVSSNKVVPINNAGPVSDDDRMSAQDNQLQMVQVQDAQE